MYRIIVGLLSIFTSVFGFYVISRSGEELQKEPFATLMPFVLVLMFGAGFFLIITPKRKI